MVSIGAGCAVVLLRWVGGGEKGILGSGWKWLGAFGKGWAWLGSVSYLHPPTPKIIMMNSDPSCITSDHVLTVCCQSCTLASTGKSAEAW